LRPLNSIVRPLDKNRATLDKDVIIAWEAQLKRRRHGVGRVVVPVLSVVLVTAFAATIFFRWHNWIALLAGLALIFTQLIYRNSLVCPNCQRTPLQPSVRGGNAESARYCPHCHYWLRRPF
jgi:hypothetical protein